MIEMIMYFGIGFLCASLLGLVLIPLVHNRATRLTMRRLEAATPLSMAEIQADKDQLRAEFAMSTRRLEMTVEQLKARSTTQLSELGRKTEAIGCLKQRARREDRRHRGAGSAAGRRSQDQIPRPSRSIRIAGQDIADHARRPEKARARREGRRARPSSPPSSASSIMVTDSQQVEIAALGTQIEALKTQLERYEKDVKDTENASRRASAATPIRPPRSSSDERGKVENLGNRVTQLERQLVAQTTEAEILGRRVQDLETRLTEQGRLLVEREYAVNQLRGELDAARKAGADLRAEFASTDDRQREVRRRGRAPTMPACRPSCAQIREERAKLQQEIAAMKRDAEASLGVGAGRTNALLRERINDIAAEVARLTMALEGPNSPIEAILAADAADQGATGAAADGRAAAATSPTASAPCKAEPRACLRHPDAAARRRWRHHRRRPVEAAALKRHDDCRAADHAALRHRPE